MKFGLFIALAALSGAQSITKTYTPDLNGRMAEAITYGAGEGARAQKAQSINGPKIPLEETQEKVLREDASGKTTERTVRRYDQTGQLASTERIVIEERKTSGGGSHSEQTTWLSDINGSASKTEQRVSDTRVSGGTSTTETAISRPSLNSGFETIEKRLLVSETSGDRKESREVVQRRGGGGQFYDAVREVRVTEKAGGSTKESTAIYEPGMTGQLELARQNVSATSKRADGSEITETSLFAAAVDGRVRENGGAQQLQEQQIREKKAAADGSVVETVSIRRPSISDPNKLGPAQKIAETVCTGKCQ